MITKLYVHSRIIGVIGVNTLMGKPQDSQERVNSYEPKMTDFHKSVVTTTKVYTVFNGTAL